MRDRLGAVLMTAATLGLLAALPAWRMTDAPPPDAFAEAAADFLARADAFAARHATGRAAEGLPLVAPPPGDVPVVARRYQFSPALELEAGKTYRLHVASVDTVHTLAVDGRELLLVPGETRVVVITPATPGPLPLQCGEYCGLGHNRMRGSITVIPPRPRPPAPR